MGREVHIDYDAKRQPLRFAMRKAIESGSSGALAMTIQVSTLMWLRTTMNYQYRYGTTTSQALRTLYADGGVRRFYRGYVPALAQGPLSRFGDTAANAGVLAVLASYDIPIALKTSAASISAGLWRIAIMPIDACKTTLQVEGSSGLKQLVTKVGTQGPTVLWRGSLAAASATMVGHFPWFFTFNSLQEYVPIPPPDLKLRRMLRNAAIGFASSVVSDTCSNSLRVIKTTRQTFPEAISYVGVVRHVVEKDGVIGLFGRGLKTRLITNGLQGLLFSVLYKQFMEMAETRRNR